MSTDLKSKLREYLVEASPAFEPDEVKDEDDLIEAGLDSLDIVNFLLSIEENLDVKISDDELNDLNSINDFAARITSATSA